MSSKETDPNGLDAHAPGAKLDAGKESAWGIVRPSWQITRLSVVATRDGFFEADRFFSVRVNPKDVYDVNVGHLCDVLCALPSDWPEGVRAVGVFGANKYTVDGYLKVENGARRYLDAGARHYLKLLAGELNDPDSGLPHLWHARWNVGATFRLLSE